MIIFEIIWEVGGKKSVIGSSLKDKDNWIRGNLDRRCVRVPNDRRWRQREDGG
jgi:hypothetical protein